MDNEINRLHSANTATNRLSAASWTLDGLIEAHSSFEAVHRISAASTPDALSAKIEECERMGVPLVIEGWQVTPGWEANLFNPDWLSSYYTDCKLIRYLLCSNVLFRWNR